MLLFTLAAALLTGLVFGLTPAFSSTRLDLTAALKGTAANVAGSAGRQRSLQALVVVQVGLSLIWLVGAGPDAKYRSLREPSPPTFYVPFFQENRGSDPTFAVRTTADPRVTMAGLASVVREVDRTVRVRDLRTMNDVVNASVHQERLIAQLGGFFSVFALALACLGLYGVLSFAVVQRTREIGVRVALGAQRHDVLSLVVGKGLRLALAGSVIGLAGAFAATRLVSNLLYGVTPTDPVTFGGVVSLLVAVAALASWLPARRAAKVDPMEALRYE